MRRNNFNELGYESLEGYAYAYLFHLSLQKAGKDLSQQTFIKAAQSLKGNYDGLEVNFKTFSTQALSSIYLTTVKDNVIIDIDY